MEKFHKEFKSTVKWLSQEDSNDQCTIKTLSARLATIEESLALLRGQITKMRLPKIAINLTCEDKFDFDV